MLVKLRNKFAIVGGAFVHSSDANADGYVEVVRYASDAAQIVKDVESDWAAVEAAKTAYERKLREYVCEKLSISPDDLPESQAQWTEDQKRLERQYTGSVEAEFHSLTGRGIKRLLDAKIVERGIAPPKSLEEELFSRVLSGVQGGGNANMDAAAVATAVIEALVEKGVLSARRNKD